MAYDLFLNSNKLGIERRPTRVPGLKTSEVMTIIMLFHQSPAKNFKFFYESYLQQYLSEFPGLPSYNRYLYLFAIIKERHATKFLKDMHRWEKVLWDGSSG
jgi:hypothetical protein